jgi:hypothetical protein
MASDSTFTVAPSIWLILWTVYVFAVVIVAILTGLKGRYGWLLIGLFLGGLPLFYSAFLTPEPGSLWARWATRNQRSAG